MLSCFAYFFFSCCLCAAKISSITHTHTHTHTSLATHTHSSVLAISCLLSLCRTCCALWMQSQAFGTAIPTWFSRNNYCFPCVLQNCKVHLSQNFTIRTACCRTSVVILLGLSKSTEFEQAPFVSLSRNTSSPTRHTTSPPLEPHTNHTTTTVRGLI